MSFLGRTTVDRYALFRCRRCESREFPAWLPPAAHWAGGGLELWPECPNCGNKRPRLVCLLERAESHPPDVEASDLTALLQLDWIEIVYSLESDDAERLRERCEALLDEVRRRREID